MPAEVQHPPLTPVHEDSTGEEAADIDIAVDWGSNTVNWAPNVTSLERAAGRIKVTQRAVSKFKRGTEGKAERPEPSYSTAPSRAQTERSADVEQGWPVMNFRDEFDNRAQAAPDGIGGLAVKFTRLVSLGMAERTQVATVLKGIAFALALSGEAVKQAGKPEAGQSAKIAGNVVTGFTQLADVANYGPSAWETARTKGLRAAIPDARKTIYQLASMGAVVAAAIYKKGENSYANAAAAGLSIFTAMSATGPSKVEEAAQEQYRREHFLGNPGALEPMIDLPALFESRSTGLTMLTQSVPTSTVGINLHGSVPSSIRSAPGRVADMLPSVQTNSSNSATTPAASIVRDLPAVSRGKRKM
ncbi:hypothetical protein [Streptomyces sp. NPDC097610]|uniref:hypothetical protein n=1 Tax=Streptomyces sp. NPDC097610 TaxID=3157227 RepID=UPI0033181440